MTEAPAIEVTPAEDKENKTAPQSEFDDDEDTLSEWEGYEYDEGEEFIEGEMDEMDKALADDQMEEEGYVEEPPPDPAAPYGLTDSSENLLPPFELRQDQVAEVEQLWAYFQDHTPVYCDIDGYITEVELFYMLESLLLSTHTPEQFQELIDFCVRPPDPNGRITYEQFLKIVTIRQRAQSAEEELKNALKVIEQDKDTGILNREYFREIVQKHGHTMIPKTVEVLIKEVDMANDGTLGLEDIVGTMCIDLNRDDINMMWAQLNPDSAPAKQEDEF